MPTLSDNDRRFWDHPPWAGGARSIRMGVRRIDFDRWLPDIEAASRQAKLATWHDHQAKVYALVDGFEETAAASAALCRQFMQPPKMPLDRPAFPPLVSLALDTVDDICLLTPSGDTYILAGACLMAPSYWRLSEKIGQTLLAIHAPVPSLAEKIGGVMIRFLERLKPGDLFERRNWFIHQSDGLFQPMPERWNTKNDRLFLRTERQTLTKLQNGVVVFTIGVDCHPFEQIQRFPAAAQDMLASFHAMDAEEKEHFGFAKKESQILPMLATAAREIRTDP